MENFTIYPKEGESFLLRAEKFELSEGEFIFYNSGDQPSEEAYVSFDDVAAIVPESQRLENVPEPPIKPLSLCLRKRDKPIPIYANAFEIKNTAKVKFFYRNFSNDPLVEFEDIYVASSEVVAIFPSEGLERVRKRSINGFPS